MTVKNLQYNFYLLEQEKALEAKLTKIRNEIKENRSSCNHIGIKIGYIKYLNKEKSTKEPIYNEYYTCKCIFCGKDLQSHDKIIDATRYKEELYNHGEKNEEKIERLNELRLLVMEYMLENPDITHDEIIEKLKEEVKNDSKELKKV